MFTAPRAILHAGGYDEVAGLLVALDRHAAAGYWCAGYLAYEAGYALDEAGFPDPPVPRGPLAWFGVYDEPFRLSGAELAEKLRPGEYVIGDFELRLDQSEYAERVAAICHHILEGDVYQINLTTPLRFRFEGDPLSLYADLLRKQRVGFGSVIRTGHGWILSRSPELFVRREGDRLTARPMKGTVRRGADTAEDLRRADWLASDPKNRAENLMIVDLLRNDLSRVSRPGTVQVPALFEVERYETLWQMTSTVVSDVRYDVGVSDILHALFPCGSVTGAPKRRAMQLIRGLEDEPRGIYCGALGFVKPGGECVFNVPIRTIELDGAEGRMGIGSGIVWDSSAEAEYDESLLKARFLIDPPPPVFELVETMRAEGGSVALLDRHLSRLSEAAEYFGYRFSRQAIVERLANLPHATLRVRVTLSRDGEVVVESAPVTEEELRLRTAAIFPEAAPADDPFLRHKTTHRPFYDRALAWAQDRGADDAILVDLRGQVVEGTFTNVWIRRDHLLCTPPLATGGVPGVYRAHLLAERDDVREIPITPDDLYHADSVLLCNALRGLQQVRLLPVGTAT